MTLEISLLILMGGFAILFVLGVPLAVALLIPSVALILIDPALSMVVVAMRIYSGIDSFVLLAIPGFMFSAFVMNRIGMTEDIVAISDLLVGRIRGGLGHVNVVSSMLMGGVSGSSTADVAGEGAIIIPVMVEKGYDKGFTAAITAASSTIGNIIPPSILMVIYGATANVSVGALFIAGYIPGILVGLEQLAIAYYYAVKNNIGGQPRGWAEGERKRTLIRGLAPFSVMVVIIGGIVFGVVTSTEAAALAAVWVVVLDLFVYRKLSWKIIQEVTLETSLLTAVVMFCVGTATLFGWLMAYYQVIDVTEKVIGYFTYDPHAFLIVVMVLFLILGTFMDPAPAMMIFVPVLVPLAQKLGIHPLHLGIIVVMTMDIGKITPPYGISLLMACSIAKIPLMESMKWAMVFFTAFVILTLAIVFWPDLALFLPRLLVPQFMGG
ncbi:MAG: TRAP transporter large permease [Deltaproteobacteria bacterium]|nr:MAG: TRAP transporter large permease [Deltaproteobacteria bacterium]